MSVPASTASAPAPTASVTFESDLPERAVKTRTVNTVPGSEPSARDSVPSANDAGPAFGLRSGRWTDRGLELTGFAHPGDRDTGRLVSALTTLSLRPSGGGRSVPVVTRHRYLPEVTDDSGQHRFNHDWAGFTATINPDRLRHHGRWRNGTWRVDACLFSGLRRQHGPLAPYWCGSGEYPPAQWVDRDVRVIPHFSDNALRLRVELVKTRITGVRPVDGGLELTGSAADCPDGTVLRLRHRQSDVELSFPLRTGEGGSFEVTVPLAPFTVPGVGLDEPEHWDPELVRPDGSSSRPVLDDRAQPLAGLFALPNPEQVLNLKQLSDGYPQFCVQSGGCSVDTVTVAGDGFDLAGTALLPLEGPLELELVLRHCNGTGELRFPVRRTGDRFATHLPAMVAGSDGGRLPLRKGIWQPLIRPVGLPGAEQPLMLAPAVLATLPAVAEIAEVATSCGHKQVLLQRRWHDTLIVDSTPVLTAAERSAYRQERLRTVEYPAAQRRPLRDAVLYDVFSGRGYADSPRAVHAELVRRGLPLEHLWVVDDAQAELPEGVRSVRSYSPEWYEALATSRYLVGNTHFPWFVTRRPGQVIVQTWHGSLLKRIAHDVENAWLGNAGYLAALDRESPQWSLVVSPSSFATPILRRAFRYQGEILESGYPRNDVLAGSDDAGAVRRRLGIPDGKRVVLYAPTWREDQQRENGDGFRLGLRLDLDAARTALGADHVLLVRPHAHVREPLPGAGDGFVYDVGDYPDVQELLLAADVLVTDYSSIMFDFAITGRPILFFTYDLEHYRDTLRGFYFDFEAEAPGPLIPTSAELLTALRDLAATPGRVPAAHAAAYEKFRSTHCHLDDGAASVRVVDRILELG